MPAVMSTQHTVSIVAFYALIAVLYATKAPNWIAYILLTLMIAYLVSIILGLSSLNNLLNNVKYPNVSSADDCAAQNTARSCGVWVPDDQKCYVGTVQGTDGCVRLGVPEKPFWVLGSLIVFNMLLIVAFVARDRMGGKGGKGGKVKK